MGITSSHDFLITLLIELDYNQPLRGLIGDFIKKISLNYNLKGVAVKVYTDVGIPFFIFSSKDEEWSYHEGLKDAEYPTLLKMCLNSTSGSVLLDGNKKSDIFIVSDENRDLILEIVSKVLKKKLIWDRDILDEKRQIVEKILRKGNHDIRSPFFGVSGFAQLINQKTSDSEVKGYCKIMMESLDRVESIITELVSGLGEKPLRIKPEDFSLTEVVKEIAEKSKDMYARCNIELNFSYEGDFHVSADPELIKNAIYGILNNAREELSDGGAIDITLMASEKNSVELSIKDTGKGIAADILDSIFKPIFKYEKSDDHLGLGLSNSLNIVKSHGGDIRIKNNCEKNTEFVIDLPLAEKEE